MSGRTFGIQSSWHDVMKILNIDIPRSEMNKAISIADSMNQQIEEFLNRYVSTSVNDDGDFIFDASGSYTFNGDVIINGDLSLNGAGIFKTSDNDRRIVIDESHDLFGLGTLYPTVQFFPSDSNFDVPGYIAAQTVSTSHFLFMYGPQGTSGGQTTPGFISLTSAGDVLFGNTNSSDGYFGSANLRMLAADGDASTPGISFFGEPDTGFFNETANEIAISVGGTKQGEFRSGIFEWLNEIHVATGAANDPSYTFTSDTDTGWYSGGSGYINAALNGVLGFYVNTSQTVYTKDWNGSGGYTRVGFRSIDTESSAPIAAGFAAHPSAKGIAPVWRSSNVSEKWLARNNPDTGYIHIDAAAFNISSRPEAKRGMARNESVLDRLRSREVVKFRREADAAPIVAFDPDIPGDEEAVRAMRFETATVAEWAHLAAQMTGPEFEEAGVDVTDWADDFPEVCNWEADEDGVMQPIGINLGAFIATTLQGLLELDARLSRPPAATIGA